MKKHLVLLSALLLQAAAVSVFAQDKPQAGDVIRGLVRDSEGPLAGVTVSEISYTENGNEKVITKTVTDEKGEFSFSVVDPENALLVTKPYYLTVLENGISKSTYDINLQKQSSIPPIKILDGPSEITTLPAVASDEKLPLPVAGSTVTGYVKSDEGPLNTAIVMEIDAQSSLIGTYYTDENGFFSFKIADPKNYLMISYVGHETIKVLIDRTKFDITLKERKDMPTVDVSGSFSRLAY